MNPTNKSELFAEFLQYGKLKSVKIIDCHTHMSEIGEASTPISEAADCVTLMKEENIESIWCSSHIDLYHLSDEVNAATKKIVAEYPDKIKGYFVFNPNRKKEYLSDIGTVLTHSGFIGLKFLPNYHNFSLDGSGYEEALSFADRYSLPVLCHTWGDKPQNSVKEVANILPRYKNLFFIMGHSAPGDLDGAIQLARKYDNVYLDICDIHRHSGIIEKMVSAVGSERILFGTDMPWYDPNYAIGSVLCAKITDKEKENIFYNNAVQLLKSSKRRCKDE